MKKFKLSELPIDTLVKLENCGDRYIKLDKNRWMVIGNECIDCPPIMDEQYGVDVEMTVNEQKQIYIEVRKSLDEYFGNYKILSLPMAVVDMALWFKDKLHTPSNVTVIEEAIKYELVEEEVNEEA